MRVLNNKLLAWAAICGSGYCDAVADTRPTVTIDSGVVIGTTTTLAGATSAVNKFIGIPYAQSPPKRFSPPQPASSRAGPLTAVETKPACIQQFNCELSIPDNSNDIHIDPKDTREKAKAIFNNPGGGKPPAESEDCLYINVYTPSGTSNSSAKAVLFWIYGGNLQFGTGGLDFYDGTSFAYNQDVIVVTHNYRTNVFGFPNSPEIADADQNAGFLDQRTALAWTRTNIAKFGGDPEKITIFGESAGGFSVKQLVANPPNPLPFRAAIIQSGGASFVGKGPRNWRTLVRLLGCDRAKSQLACMRNKPPREIKSKIEHQELDFPTVPNDLTSTFDIRSSISSGRAAKVPILVGSNRDEGRVFAYLLGLDQPGGSFIKFLKAQFPGENALIRAILRAFSKSTQIPYELSSEVITNTTFLCTTSLLASFTYAHGYDVWRYHFSGHFPNTNVFPQGGAYHSSEIPEVFGTYPRNNELGMATKQQIELSEYMQRAWADFAKNPSEGPGWPSLGKSERIGELGANGFHGEQTINSKDLDKICVLYAPVIDKNGL